MPESSKHAVVLAPPRDVIVPAYPDVPTTIPVFLGCDDKFLPHALTVIASVMAHASPENNYDLFIVQSGIPRERMDVAAAWMERYPNATLRFVDIGAKLAEIINDLTITREFGVATYFRIFAPGIFSGYKKMAYLDSDIVVLSDVAGFYHWPLEGCQIGGCLDYVSTGRSLEDADLAEFWRRELGKTPGTPYFFAGGVVIDLEQMREKGTERAFFEKIRVIKDSKLPDQDVMNSVLDGQAEIIPGEWNSLDWMCDEQEEAPNFLLLRADARREVAAARKAVKVIHFAEKKPWTMEYRGKNAGKYWRYAAETPFYKELLDRIREDSAPRKLLSRRLKTRMQELHFTVKLLFAPAEGKEKYRARLRNLEWRRKGLARQTAFVSKLLAEADAPEKNGNVG